LRSLREPIDVVLAVMWLPKGVRQHFGATRTCPENGLHFGGADE
jgi:hypothetical protein